MIVGIGASAGGLQALERFFSTVPLDSNCCFVVVQHLSPDFKSILEDLLARKTRLPIFRVEHGMAAAPNTVFLIPPKKLMTIKDGRFLLSERDIATVAELPINIFLRSLAAERGIHAVGVVLSGGGSDGTAGLRAIAAAGGLTLAQRPDTAEFVNMPRSAIEARVVGHTLAPEDMAAVIIAHSRDPKASMARRPFEAEPAAPEPSGDPLERIMFLLRRSTGVDFSQYKIGTVGRRIKRRADLAKMPDLETYASRLSVMPDELNSLYSDLLIGVTEFFRDAEAFELLRKKVLPALLSPDRQNEVRVWIAACATGEEAYSLAILLDEFAASVGFTGNFAIFATDVHRSSLDFASNGLYPSDRLANVGADRLARYFREEKPGQFRIIPAIRKRLVFAPQNLVNDPPFTKLDLICCRNLLIYFNAELQERAMRLFYFALRDGGFLFLGPSEGIGKLDGVHFETIDSKFKFFRRLGGPAIPPQSLRQQPGNRTVSAPAPALLKPNPGVALSRQLLAAYDQILRRHVAAGVLVNESLEVLHYFGSVSRYLRPLEGRAHESLLHRVDGDLRLALTTLLPRVFKTGEGATSGGVRVETDEGTERIDVAAEPIADGRAPVSLVHVSFVNSRPALPEASLDGGTTQGFVASEEILQHISDLEVELRGTKESLQTAIEELQTSNEELQASNEELIASNEELQSTNEELHAVNEELYTVNAEFERKNVELQLLNDDLNNLSDSTDAGMVFVDRELRIRKFNSAIQRIFPLQPQDFGRPIDNIAYHLDGQAVMLRDVRTVLESGDPMQKEVRTREGRWLLKRVLPFRTAKGAIDGVVLTFTDINETKKLQDRLNLAMDSSHLVWWEWSLQTGQLAVHCGQSCFLGYSPDNLPKSASEWEAATHPEDLPGVLVAIQACLDGESNEWTREHRFRRLDGSWCWVLNSGKVTEADALKRPLGMIGITQDITKRRLAEETVQRDAWLLSTIQEAIICYNEDGIITYWNQGATKLFGWTEGEMVGQNYAERYPDGEPRDSARKRMEHVLKNGDIYREREDWRKDGSRVWTEARAVRVKGGRGRFSGVISLYHDISARKRAEQERRQLELQLLQAHKMETMGTLAGGIAHDFNNILAAILGYTELAMLEGPVDERSQRMHEGILQAARRARDLVKRILTFSRFHEPELTPTRMGDVITEAAKFIRASLPATIELKLELGEACPQTLADPNQLHQVILNLATNAAHAMRERAGTLTIRMATVDLDSELQTATGPLKAGSYISVEVADSGHGIDPETMTKIFDPFFTTKPVGEGTGLGLSIVHGIIKSHEGCIDVSSDVGVGTTFKFFLPVVAPAAESDAPGSAPAASLPKGNRQRVAVIDDEENVVSVVQAALQGLGYEVLTFKNAEDFYSDFSSMPFKVDLVLTDQTMPRMTGLDLALKLRSDGHSMPIIISSGYSRELTAESIAAIGRVELLNKPYEGERLAAAVHRALTSSSSRSNNLFGAEGTPL